MAVLDDPARFQPPGAFRHGVRGGGRFEAAAYHDPPRLARIARTILRDPGRTLRWPIPALAGTRSGCRHEHHGPSG